MMHITLCCPPIGLVQRDSLAEGLPAALARALGLDEIEQDTISMAFDHAPSNWLGKGRATHGVEVHLPHLDPEDRQGVIDELTQECMRGLNLTPAQVRKMQISVLEYAPRVHSPRKSLIFWS